MEEDPEETIDADELDAEELNTQRVELIRLVQDRQARFIINGPIIIGVDNEAAITVSKDHGVTKRNMHWERVIHYLRDAVLRLRVICVWVDTDSHMADFHSKVVTAQRFFRNRAYHLVAKWR